MNETQCRSRLLQLACLLSGGTAFLSLLIAVTSDHWLQAADPVPVPSSTDMCLTEEVETKPSDDAYDRVKMPYVVINTFSGLWRICIMLPAEGWYRRVSVNHNITVSLLIVLTAPSCLVCPVALIQFTDVSLR